MKVYHGSYMEIDEIDLSKCQTNRDFGRGFYVTGIIEQAEYWAERKGGRYGARGYVTEFTFNESAFEQYGLKTLRFDGYTEEWLDFVVMNRNNDSTIPAHDYDIVEGPVADDNVTRRIYVYLEGGIVKEDFLEELKFHHPSHQIVFCTVRSLQMIKRKIRKSELDMMNIDEAVTQALVAEHGFLESKAIDLYFNSATYNRLADESSGLYQKPWTDVYQLLLQELKIKN
jgi:hypothetical protein